MWSPTILLPRPEPQLNLAVRMGSGDPGACMAVCTVRGVKHIFIRYKCDGERHAPSRPPIHRCSAPSHATPPHTTPQVSTRLLPGP
eukprot:4984826-Prymnesium_polylepis.1